MLRPRLIPTLLIRNKGLTKTVGFADGKYVGDPLNAVRIFNEKMVDELVVLDIDATARHYEPNTELIGKLAEECRMPLCYGGGIKTVGQAKTIIKSGVEKIAISSAAIENPDIVSEIARELGSQSVVVVLDVRKKRFRKAYEVCTHNGTVNTHIDPLQQVVRLQELGAGEIVVNSIDRDGRMEGYDIALMSAVRDATTVPLTALGGAGNLTHVRELVDALGVMGAAAGSMFVFKGSYKAVLINYPNEIEKKALLAGDAIK